MTENADLSMPRKRMLCIGRRRHVLAHTDIDDTGRLGRVFIDVLVNVRITIYLRQLTGAFPFDDQKNPSSFPLGAVLIAP